MKRIYTTRRLDGWAFAWIGANGAACFLATLIVSIARGDWLLAYLFAHYFVGCICYVWFCLCKAPDVEASRRAAAEPAKV